MLLEETELRDIQKIARRKRMTVAEWVRQALRDARRREPMRDVTKKLDAVRVAARHEFPTADVDTMLAEIERGYVTPDAP